MPTLDHPACAEDRRAFEKRLDELGPETVAAMLSLGAFPPGHSAVIHEWLTRQRKRNATPKG